MKVPITSSSFSEKDNKIELTKSEITIPKFEDIVDVKNYNKNINEINSIAIDSNKKAKNPNLKFCCKKLGHTLCLFSDKMGNPLIMIGPHWPMYACFCGILSLGFISFFYKFYTILNLFLKIFGVLSFSIYFFSYTGTFLLNPGYPERNVDSLKGNPRIKYKFCMECNIWERIDRNIFHCPECGVCIEGYDHHCPWTGKCIGKKTIYYFYTFITSVFVVFLFFIVALIYIDYNGEKKRKKF